MTQIIKGSISSIATNGDTALAILNATVALVCDRSSSMNEYTKSRKTRAQLEDEVVTELQSRYSGKIAVVGFNSSAYLCEDGVLPSPTSDTSFGAAFEVAEALSDAGLRVILVSDGEPNEIQYQGGEDQLLTNAKCKFHGNMDCIFVGDENSAGERFMQRLAEAVGGSATLCDLNEGSRLLEETIETLLLKAG